MATEWLTPVKITEDLALGDVQAFGVDDFDRKVCASMEEELDYNYYQFSHNSRPLSYTETLINLYNNLNRINKKAAFTASDKEAVIANKQKQQEYLANYFAPSLEEKNIDLAEIIKFIAAQEYPRIEFKQDENGYFIINDQYLPHPNKIDRDKAVDCQKMLLHRGETQENYLPVREVVQKALQPADELFAYFNTFYKWEKEERVIEPPEFWYVQHYSAQLKRMNNGKKLRWEEFSSEEDLMKIRLLTERLLSPNFNVAARKTFEQKLATILYRHGCVLRRREMPTYGRDLTLKQIGEAERMIASIEESKEIPAELSRIIKNQEELKQFAAQINVHKTKIENDMRLERIKTSALRTAFNGMVHNPEDDKMLSSALVKAQDKYLSAREVAAEEYDLSTSLAWSISSQISTIKELEPELLKGLMAIRFPPENLAELTMADIYSLISRGGRLKSLSQTERLLAQESDRVFDGVLMSSSAKSDANIEFANKYEKQLRHDLSAFRAAYNNVEAGIDIEAKLSAEEIDSIIYEMQKGRSGVGANMTSLYKKLFVQLEPNRNIRRKIMKKYLPDFGPKSPRLEEKAVVSAIRQVMENRIYKQKRARGDYAQMEDTALMREVQEEVGNIINSFKFQIDVHHGEEISNVVLHKDDKDFDFTQINSAENTFQVSPKLHYVLFHMMNVRIDFRGKTHPTKISGKAKTPVFHNQNNGIYWAYEVVPAPHVKAFLCDGSLIFDDQYYNVTKQRLERPTQIIENVMPSTAENKKADQRVRGKMDKSHDQNKQADQPRKTHHTNKENRMPLPQQVERRA